MTTNNLPIQVLVFDDVVEISNRIEQILKDSTKIEIVETFFSLNDILGNIVEYEPEVILMDIDFGENGERYAGIEVITKIKKHFPNVKILMQTTFEDTQTILRAIHAGADSYILKKDMYEGLENAILQTNAGGAYMSPSIAKKIWAALEEYARLLNSPFAVAKQKFGLTDKEIEVLSLLARGKKMKGVSEVLGIGFHAVNDHTKSIYFKVGVNSLPAAIWTILYGE